ncbi:MAG: hypothetical protein MI717_14025 [Spirochaetales bacterium]|nr:hypothetical protein [Spirochaetales bacterium]
MRKHHLLTQTSRNNFLAIALLLAFIVVPGLGAQDTPVTIRQIVIEIPEDGKTQEGALRRFLDIQEGESFASETALAEAVEIQMQDLINERVFKSVTCDYTMTTENEATVRVAIEDSWTLIPIPYPLPDSNIGFKIGIETTYDNAFGTMTNWYLDTYLTLGNDFDGKYGINGFKVNPEIRNIKIGDLRFEVGMFHEYRAFAIKPTNDYTEYFTKHRTFLSFGTEWEFTDNIYYGFYPNASLNYGYKWRVTDASSKEKRYNLVWRHYVNPRDVDIVGNNLRQGYDVTLQNQVKAVGTATPGAQKTSFEPVVDFSLSAVGYYTFWSRLNFYHRFYGFYVYNDIYKNRGEYLRGVSDDSMTGNWGFFLQNSFGVDVFHWKGVFDIQLHPFFDIGYSLGGVGDSSDRLRYGFGSDVLIFIDAISNLTLRATVGVDPINNYEVEFAFASSYSF